MPSWPRTGRSRCAASGGACRSASRPRRSGRVRRRAGRERLTLRAPRAPYLLSPDNRQFENEWNRVTGRGWLPLPQFARSPSPDAALRRAHTAGTRAEFSAAVPYARLTERSRRAFWEMKSLCDRHGARMAVIYMPDLFEPDYPAAARERVAAEVSALARSLGVPLLDFRGWGRDDEFFDGVHFTHPGAGRFTAELEGPLLRAFAGHDQPARQ